MRLRVSANNWPQEHRADEYALWWADEACLGNVLVEEAVRWRTCGAAGNTGSEGIEMKLDGERRARDVVSCESLHNGCCEDRK